MTQHSGSQFVSSPRLGAVWLAACALAGILVGNGSLSAQETAESSPAAPAVDVENGDQEIVIAVLDFADKGPSVALAPLRGALAAMLTGDLSKYQGLRSVERGRVSQFLAETKLDESGFLEQSAARKAGQVLAADYLLTGTFAAADERIELNLSLFKLGEQQPIANWKLSSPVAEVFELEQTLVGNIVTALGMKSPVLRPAPEAKPGFSPTVAVMPFRNFGPSARLQAMELGFSDILNANLGSLPDVRLVDRADLFRVLQEQSLSLEGIADPQSTVKVGRLLGAERIIYGSFVELGESLRIDLRLVDAVSTTVLSSQSAVAKTESFAEQIEALALKIAADLAIKTPDNALALVKSATPARNLETLMHFVNAEQDNRRSQFAASAANYERALLLEPGNVHAAYRRFKAWIFQGDFPQAVTAGDELLTFKFSPEQVQLKEDFYQWLLHSYSHAGSYDQYETLRMRFIAEFPETEYAEELQYQRAIVLARTGELAAADKLLESAVEAAKEQGKQDLYELRLRNLYTWYLYAQSWIQGSTEFQQRRSDPEYQATVAREVRDRQIRAILLYRSILKTAEGKVTPGWWEFAKNHIPNFDDLGYTTEEGLHLRFLDPQQHAQYVERTVKVFGWVPEAAYRGHVKLAELREHRSDWPRAINSHQYLLSHPQDAGIYQLPIEPQLRIAEIRHEILEDAPGAIREYRKLVSDFGIVHERGVNAVASLHQLGSTVEFPKKAALVWGGDARVHAAWRRVLKPFGMTTHHVGLDNVNVAHLSPYALVVLVRSRNLPFTPDDVLALRAYVATGGSLLCIVSPGWDAAAPGIHNGLLEFFGAHADNEMVVRANSTSIAPEHPITRGVQQVMAKNAVNLDVPENCGLITANDKTVLAAIPYRNGRVVLAAFAQWFQPDPFILKQPIDWPQALADVPFDDLPPELPPHLQLPLLQQVVGWLLEPTDNDEGLQARRNEFATALMKGFDSHIGTTSRAASRLAANRLIDESPGDAKEEALWAAAELFQYQAYAAKRVQIYPKWTERGPKNFRNTWTQDKQQSTPETAYYQRLVEQFPGSSLTPAAQWRFADSIRCLASNREKSSNAARSQTVLEAQREFRRIKAPESSIVEAWTQLRLGQLKFASQNYTAAIKNYEQVSEKFETSPEKILAVLDIAACHDALGNTEEATRYYKVALQMPDVSFPLTGPSNWMPMTVAEMSLRAKTVLSRGVARRGLQPSILVPDYRGND